MQEVKVGLTIPI